MVFLLYAYAKMHGQTHIKFPLLQVEDKLSLQIRRFSITINQNSATHICNYYCHQCNVFIYISILIPLLQGQVGGQSGAEPGLHSSSSVSPVNSTPPTLHTRIRLHVALTTKTNERCLCSIFLTATLFRKLVSKRCKRTSICSSFRPCPDTGG